MLPLFAFIPLHLLPLSAWNEQQHSCHVTLSARNAIKNQEICHISKSRIYALMNEEKFHKQKLNSTKGAFHVKDH